MGLLREEGNHHELTAALMHLHKWVHHSLNNTIADCSLGYQYIELPAKNVNANEILNSTVFLPE